MAISTLSRFTVPLASDASSASQGLLMPKLKYCFRVLLVGFGAAGTVTTELTKQVKDATRPKVTFDEITLDVYNSKIYLAGKHSWETMTLTLRDDASGNVQRLVGQQLQKQLDFYEQASAASGQDYKFTVIVEVLDGGNGAQAPNILETFELYGCFVTNADYGDLNYTESAEATVALTLRYDNAIQYKGGVVDGIGRTIGARTLGTATSGGGNI